MQATEYRDISISCAKFLLNFTGLGITVNREEERRRRRVLMYTLTANLYFIYLSMVDIFHSLDDLSHCIFGVVNVLCMLLICVKISIMTAHREGFLEVAFLAHRMFWQKSYDGSEKVLVERCQNFCKIFVFTICCFCQASLSGYILTPLWINIEKNKSDRAFPFNIWSDLPVTATPYYEIIFTFQAMCVYQVGASYIASDVFFCLMITHVICHFRILQHKLQNLWKTAKEQTGVLDYGDNCYVAIKKCIRQHQSLIAFCDKLEDVYSYVILGHMVIFSLLMCLDTFQMLLANIPTVTRVIFIFHMVGSFVHVVFFSYTCHSLMEESRNVSFAIYLGWWTVLPMNNAGKMLRKDIQIMIMRSLRPCCLTAGGYFPVSLQTSTTLVSSTISYFTLMRESSMKSEDE